MGTSITLILPSRQTDEDVFMPSPLRRPTCVKKSALEPSLAATSVFTIRIHCFHEFVEWRYGKRQCHNQILHALTNILQFTSVIIKVLGHNTLATLLLGMPQRACQVVFTLAAALLANRLRFIIAFIIAFMLCIATVGWCLVGQLPSSHKSGRLAGVFIFAAYAAGFLLTLLIIASDVAGYTRKTVVSAILFLAYCAGNVAGPKSSSQRKRHIIRLDAKFASSVSVLGFLTLFSCANT